MIRFLFSSVLLLAPSLASAARYDPDADRAALRQSATLCYSTIVDASGLALEPEKARTIAAGLDEGLRLAGAAAVAARSLGAAAKRRGEEIETSAKTIERALKETSDPIAAERLRARRLASVQAELKRKLEDLPKPDQKEARPLFEKASGALQAADDALRPLEDHVKLMGEEAVELASSRSASKWLLVEISSVADAAIIRAEELPAPVSEAKERLGALGQEPRAAARTRAWEKLDLLRGISSRLLDAGDRACNRADEFRRLSAGFEKSFGVFETSRLAAAARQGGAKTLMNDAQAAQDKARERIEKPK